MVNRVSSSFSKGVHSATKAELKKIMNKHKVKRYQNSDTKTGNREPQRNNRLETVSNTILGVLN